MSDKKNNKIPTLVFSALLVIALVLRVIHLAGLMDFETGFFTDFGNVTVLPFYICIVVGALGLIVTEKIGDSYKKLANAETNVIAGIGQVVLAVTILINTISPLKTLIETIKNTGFYFKEISNGIGGVAYAVLPVFGVLAVISLLLNAVCSFTGKHFEDKTAVLNTMPSFWALLKVLASFMVTTSYLHKSELFVDIFTYTFAMIALFEYSRLISGVGITESGYYFKPTCIAVIAGSVMSVLYGVFSGNIEPELVKAGMIVFFVTLLAACKKAPAEVAGKESESNDKEAVNV